MRPVLTSLAIAAFCLPALPLAAQERPKTVEADHVRRELDRKELEERLEEKRAGTFTKMMPANIVKKRKVEQKKWLKKFQVIQSDHYLVYTNAAANSVKKFAKSLEEMYEFIRERFPFKDEHDHLTAYIFRTKDDYTEFCVNITGYERSRAKKTAGHANSRYYATYYQSPTASTVVHESSHQVVYVGLGISGVGSWFQEGIAVYIEKLYTGEGKPSAGMKGALRSGRYYPLEKLFSLGSLLGDPEGNGRRSYDHSGALIDFMVNTKLAPLAGKFPEFLRNARGVRRGLEPSRKLIRETYGLSLDELELLWKKHYGLKN
ncbi:MAG: hypothetical protein ACYTG5_02795 [Planctomycetota bacterium]|jgi:hypothetical protein